MVSWCIYVSFVLYGNLWWFEFCLEGSPGLYKSHNWRIGSHLIDECELATPHRKLNWNLKLLNRCSNKFTTGNAFWRILSVSTFSLYFMCHLHLTGFLVDSSQLVKMISFASPMIVYSCFLSPFSMLPPGTVFLSPEGFWSACILRRIQ